MYSISSTLAHMLQEAGFAPRSYSGRGMNGECCVGVAMRNDTPAAIGVKLARYIAGSQNTYSNIDSALEELVEVMEDTCTDQLGRGTIVYWPEANWSEQVDMHGEAFALNEEAEEDA